MVLDKLFEAGRPCDLRKPPTPQPGSQCDNLPQELIDYILDFIHDDPKSLSACSLTRKSWLSGSRYHLFSTLHIREPNRPPTKRDPIPRLLRFLGVLRSKSSSFKLSIRELQLSGTGQMKGDRDAICLDYFTALMLELPLLETLAIDSAIIVDRFSKEENLGGTVQIGDQCVWLDKDKSRQGDMVDIPANVRALRITESKLLHEGSPIEILSRLLRRFPSLNSLTLHRVTENYRTGSTCLPSSNLIPPISSPAHSIPLESLDLILASGSQGPSILNLFTQCYPLGLGFKQLKVTCNSSYDLGDVSSYLSSPSTSPDLQLRSCHLTLFESSFLDHPYLTPVLDFKHCHLLESLTVAVYLHRVPSNTNPVDVNYGLSVMSSLSKLEHLTHLSFILLKHRDFDIETHRIASEEIDYARMDEMVAGFAHLQSFRFSFRYNEEELWDVEREYVTGRLPRLWAKGILTVL